MSPHATAPLPTSGEQAWLTEAIRHLEARGPLEDSDAMRHAAEQARQGAGHAQQIGARAQVLAERLRLPEDLARLRQWAPLALLLLAGLMGVLGWLMARGVMDVHDRRINVLGALGLLLGVHTLTFVFWLLTLLWGGTSTPAFGLPALWTRLTQRLALRRRSQAQALLQSGGQLLGQARLWPWVGGLASHFLWTVSLSAALATLVFALSFRQYTLGWESTLLAPQTFTQALHTLGHLPSWLGFSLPDAGLLNPTELDAPQSAERNRQLAWWLIGCVFSYGLLPRLLALALCAGMCGWRRPLLQPELSHPYYRQLITRLDAMAPAVVVDADTLTTHTAPAAAARPSAYQPGWAVVGFELPPETSWPPALLTRWESTMNTPLLYTQQLAGSMAERQALLQTLAALRPEHVMLVVSASASPDRGTERLLRAVLPLCGACRLWLSAPDAAPALPAHTTRWQRWLADNSLNEVKSFIDGACALNLPQASPDTTTAAKPIRINL